MVFAIIGGLFVLPLISQAIGADGVGVSPANPSPDVAGSDVRFAYNLDLGQSVTDAIKLANYSPEKKMKVKIYPVDAVVSPQGVFNPLAETDLKNDLGAWIQIKDSEVILDPQETRKISFTLSIPKTGVSVGDHWGAIIVEKAELTKTNQPGLSIKTRVGISVRNRVPGEIIQKLIISKVSWEIKNKNLSPKPTTGEKIKTVLGFNKEGLIILELKNEGNTHLSPKANIEITDLFGGHVDTLEYVSLGSSALGQTSTVPIKWQRPSLFGRLTAKIDIVYGDNNQTVEAKKSFWTVPWTLIFIFVILLVLCVFVQLFWRLYYAKKKLKMAQYAVLDKETLIEIADKFNVKWKKLARINRLKPPYILRPGQTLFVPKKKNK